MMDIALTSNAGQVMEVLSSWLAAYWTFFCGDVGTDRCSTAFQATCSPVVCAALSIGVAMLPAVALLLGYDWLKSRLRRGPPASAEETG